MTIEIEAEDEAQSGAALGSLTVLDLSEGVAGAFATKLMADYGARVIKIEAPGVGDAARRHGPFPNSVPHLERSALFLYLNTNKLSVTLDYTTRTGALLLKRLIGQCDGLVEDYPSRRREDLLSEAGIREQTPRFVIAQASAYGSSGPYSGRPATNLTSYASGGQMAISGDADREPLLAGGYQAEYQLGLHAFTATLAALWQAAETGRGQVVDIDAMEAMATTLEVGLSNYLYRQMSGLPPAPPNMFQGLRRRGNSYSAAIGLYPCADGYLGIHAQDRQMQPLLDTMGVDDPTLAKERLTRNDELAALIYAWAADLPKREAYRLAGEHKASISYVHDMKDLVESEQLQARRAIREIDHPEAGRLLYPRGPFQMSEAPWLEGRAPLLGEHNETVLCAMLGLARDDLVLLRGAKVI